MALLGPLDPPVGYGTAKFGARFNRQLSSIPHVCVRSLHVPSPLRFFKTHLKKWFACLFVTEKNVIQYQTWTNRVVQNHSFLSIDGSHKFF